MIKEKIVKIITNMKNTKNNDEIRQIARHNMSALTDKELEHICGGGCSKD